MIVVMVEAMVAAVGGSESSSRGTGDTVVVAMPNLKSAVTEGLRVCGRDATESPQKVLESGPVLAPTPFLLAGERW